jgi:zinc transport system substrate-binding protein
MASKALVAGLGTTCALIGCRQGPTTVGKVVGAGGRVVVAASIFPIADTLKQVGGNRVEVITLLPPGQTPHDYQPTPATAEKLARARLLVLVGIGLDDWARRSAKAEGRKGLEILDLGSKILSTVGTQAGTQGPAARPDTATTTQSVRGESGPPEGEREGHEADNHAHGHEHGGVDPHLWLDPIVMMQVTDLIADALCRVDPAGSATYKDGALRFRAELADLDKLCASRLRNLPHKEFVTLHAAFGRFADRYGLRQLSIRNVNAEEAGPKRLEQVVEFIEKHRIKAVFAEPQFPAERLEAIARQTGAVVSYLDPEGAPGVPGHDSYVTLMRTNLDALVAALSR